MTVKNFIFLTCTLLILFACNTNNPKDTESQNSIVEGILPTPLPESLQSSDEAVTRRNETLDLDCLASLDNPIYEQLRDQVTMLIPFENYDLRLLAWDSQVDDYPNYFDSALFWVKQDGEDPRWLLINMFRLPKSPHPSWQLDEATDGAWKGFQEFSVPPRRNDVYYFTPNNSFGYAPRFSPYSDFKFLKAKVCEQTWRETIGGAPPHYVGLNQS